MQRRKIGDVEVSVVGLGGNNFGMRTDEKMSRAVIHADLDAGVTLIDTADSYAGSKSEEILPYFPRSPARRCGAICFVKVQEEMAAADGRSAGWVSL